jgi:hypothetical protein
MKKFVITEQEKKHILGLYEQNQTYSELQKKVSEILEIPIDEFNIFYQIPSTGENLVSKFLLSLKPLVKSIFSSMCKFAKTPGKLSEIQNKLSNLWSDNPEDTYLLSFILDWSASLKKGFTKRFEEMSDETKEKYINKQVEPGDFSKTKNTQVQTDEKINTTNDKAYDYKLSNGKYYYTKKGQNNWIEANGKGLEAIKSKVKF